MHSRTSSLRTFGAVVVTAILLAACQSAEDRAQGHYESALQLVEGGDPDRAIVEFRNVFENNPRHLEARLALAALYRDTGDLGRAYQNFLLASEEFPSDYVARINLSELAAQMQNWEEFRRHAARAVELNPEDLRAQVVGAVLDYQTAVETEVPSDRRTAATQIQQVRDDLKNPDLADQVIIDNLLRDGAFREALDRIDASLAQNAENEPLQQLKLQILGRLGDEQGIRDHLESLISLFPENEAYAETLIQWFVGQGDTEAAEAFIRSRIGEGDGGVEQRTLLIAFLSQTRGPEAALAEAEAAVAAGANPDLFRSLAAGLKFDAGQRDEAIAEMEAIVAEADPSDQTLRIKVALARMLLSIGNEVAARQRVEEVLESDATQVDATKMRAAWLIEDDRMDDAIVALRGALDQAPSDPQIMTLMAQAHLRNGNRGLAGEMLALAAEAAGAAPAQSLEYARFLTADGNLNTAETVLIDSLRVAPGNFSVLALLGQVYVGQEDWNRAEQVEATLRRLETEAATEAADSLRLTRLQQQEGSDVALRFLQGLADDRDGATAADVAIVRTHVASGDLQAARAHVDGLLETAPDNPGLRLLNAGVLIAEGKPEEAERIYRTVLEEDDQSEGVWRALYFTKIRQGDLESAGDLLREALEAIPDAPNLLWALAGELERSGDIDGAIGIYEQLYERLSGSPIVANNLASLLATYREDDAALERAFVVSRRLRGADVPAFQDTYGWIAFRRGELDEALEHLEPAAAGLPDDPIVQYHYARALAEADRNEEALQQFRKAIEVAGPADSRQQFEVARSEIERIEGILSAQ